MASTIIQFDAPDGLTLTGKLYADAADTIVNGASGDSATERTNNLGTYTITVTEALTGLHHLRVTDANDVTLAKYSVILADDTSTYTAFDPSTSNIEDIKTVTDKMVFTTANQLDVQTISMATNSMTADAAATDFIGAAEIASGASQEIADLIAADWIAGDASPLAIVAALKADAEWSNLVTLATAVAALQTDLDNGTDGLGALKTLIDTLTTTVGTAGAGLTNITLANDLSATMKTSVQTAMDAAIDTAIAELGVGAPTATPTLRTGLMLLYQALRNKIDATSSTLEVHNDAGTIVASKALTDDGTTYSEAKMISG